MIPFPDLGQLVSRHLLVLLLSQVQHALEPVLLPFSVFADPKLGRRPTWICCAVGINRDAGIRTVARKTTAEDEQQEAVS